MTNFRILRGFDLTDRRTYAGAKALVGRNCLSLFPGDRLEHRLARELCHERALPIKELAEAFEFFATVRKHVRQPEMVDLCSGHGLVGILFAAFERKVERVRLIDRRRPQRFENIWRAAVRAAPWVAEKVSYAERKLKGLGSELTPGTGVVGVHACGKLTDDCLELGAGVGGPIAVLPCCRSHSRSEAPPAIENAFGGDLAYDIHRTYAMEARGYRVRWREIPQEITPMNRVLIATPRKALIEAAPALATDSR